MLKPKPLPLPTAVARTDDVYAPIFQALPPGVALSTTGCIAALWGSQSFNDACEISTIFWITKVQDEPIFQQTPTLQKSVLAVCLASIGKQHKAEHIIQHGLQLYGAAVTTLSAALRRLPPSTPPPDAMLVTTRVLAMHEVIKSPPLWARPLHSCVLMPDFAAPWRQIISRGAAGGYHLPPPIHAWPIHKMGELALLTARSPDTFVEGPSHEMFAEARFMCVGGPCPYPTIQ